jgi:hypothetical protein
LLGCFKINDQLELGRLLDGQIGGSCSLQNVIDIHRSLFGEIQLISYHEYLISCLVTVVTGYIMGAIAVSKKEEEQIEKLRKDLGIASKSGVIRTALRVLEKKSREEKLRREIRESVSRCAAADRLENRELFPAGVARSNRDE